MTDLPVVVAFLAGIVSFISPCVLPLIPGYLAYLGGTSVADATKRRGDIFLNSLFFTLGFSLIFALFGVLLNTLLERVAYDAQEWLSRIGGVLIIFFGFSLLGLFRIGIFDREYKIHVRRQFRSRWLTSFVFGAAFAGGWTPCVGAVLGSILGLAALQPGIAFGLLLAYAAGFCIPLLLVAFCTAPAARLIAKYGSWAATMNKLFGALLIVLGVLIFTQTLPRLASFGVLQQLFAQ